LIEIALKKVGNKLIPHSIKDEERLSEFRDYQVIRGKLTGVKKPRSYEQLKMYWALCEIVSENTDDPNWNSKVKVDEQCKIQLRHIDTRIVINGAVHIKTKSISFQELPHIEACGFFTDAFQLMADFLQVPLEELLKEGAQR